MQAFAHAPLRRRGQLIGTAAVAAALFAAAPQANAAFPGRNGKVAFAASFTCGFESSAIASVNSDGTGLERLTGCQLITSSPDWSPDGRSLLYDAVGSKVFRIAADGSHRRTVSRGSAPSVAPDGSHYAYVRNPPGPTRKVIRRRRLDGSHDRFLAVGNLPRWSPNGGTIAYYREGIWIMSARSGKPLRRLASREFRPLDWSPDGRRLVCARYLNGDPANADLYVVRADGSLPPRQLTQTAAKSEAHAAWSPNGRRIVVVATTSPKPFYRQYAISTMTPRGTRAKRIWRSVAFEEDDENFNAPAPTVSWQPRPH